VPFEIGCSFWTALAERRGDSAFFDQHLFTFLFVAYHSGSHQFSIGRVVFDKKIDIF
jgi:hypothetical protein